MSIGEVYSIGYWGTNFAWVSELLEEEGITEHVITAGATFSVGDAEFKLLWPYAEELKQPIGKVTGTSGNGGTVNINSYSMLLKLTYGEDSCLFTSDIYKEAQDEILARYDASELEADILKIAHHGYENAHNADFINTVSADYAFSMGGVAMSNAARQDYVDAGTSAYYSWMNGNGYANLTGSGVTFTVDDADIVSYYTNDGSAAESEGEQPVTLICDGKYYENYGTIYEAIAKIEDSESQKGTISLNSDIVLTQQINIDGIDVTITDNGNAARTISRGNICGSADANTNRMFYVYGGGTLRLIGKAGLTITGDSTSSTTTGEVRGRQMMMIGKNGESSRSKVFIQDNVTIKNNYTTSYGAIAYVYGTIEMTGGVVEGGRTTGYGGAFFFGASGLFKMYGGTVRNCSAGDAAVSTVRSTTADSGSTVYCTAGSLSGGLYLGNKSTMQISGSGYIDKISCEYLAGTTISITGDLTTTDKIRLIPDTAATAGTRALTGTALSDNYQHFVLGGSLADKYIINASGKVADPSGSMSLQIKAGEYLEADFITAVNEYKCFKDIYLDLTFAGESIRLSPAGSEGSYTFTFGDISVRQMTEVITARLMGVLDSGAALTIYEIKAEDNYSIAAYCSQIAETYPDDEELLELVANMLVYGAAAQKYTGYNTDNLADSDAWVATKTQNYEMTEEERTATAYRTLERAQEPGSYISGAGLSITDKMGLYLTLYSPDPSQLTIRVSSASVGAYEVPVSSLTARGGNKYRFYIRDIMPDNYDESYEITVLDAEDHVLHHMSYSVYSYLYSMRTYNEGELTELIDAIYNYSRSAKAYTEG